MDNATREFILQQVQSYNIRVTDGKFKLLTIDPYYEESLKEAQALFAKLSAMGPSAKQAYAEEKKKNNLEGMQERFNAAVEERRKYESIRDELESIVGTPDDQFIQYCLTHAHLNLESFMCNTQTHRDAIVRESSMTWSDIYARELSNASNDIKYFSLELTNQKNSVEKANRLIRSLSNILEIECV